MEFKILTNKREVDGSIDFLDSTFRNTSTYEILDVFVVTQSYVMRWDKISSKYYGTPDYADGLFKFNEYDNPFSLNIDDEVIIPTRESLDNMYVMDTSLNTEPPVIDNTPVIVKTKDSNRANFLIRKELRTIPTANKNPQEFKNVDGKESQRKGIP